MPHIVFSPILLLRSESVILNNKYSAKRKEYSPVFGMTIKLQDWCEKWDLLLTKLWLTFIYFSIPHFNCSKQCSSSSLLNNSAPYLNQVLTQIENKMYCLQCTFHFWEKSHREKYDIVYWWSMSRFSTNPAFSFLFPSAWLELTYNISD